MLEAMGTPKRKSPAQLQREIDKVLAKPRRATLAHSSRGDAPQIVKSLRGLAEPELDPQLGWVIRDYAPAADDVSDTAPGSPWAEECARLLAEIETALPPGWEATWIDDDVLLSKQSPR